SACGSPYSTARPTSSDALCHRKYRRSHTVHSPCTARARGSTPHIEAAASEPESCECKHECTHEWSARSLQQTQQRSIPACDLLSEVLSSQIVTSSFQLHRRGGRGRPPHTVTTQN